MRLYRASLQQIFDLSQGAGSLLGPKGRKKETWDSFRDKSLANLFNARPHGVLGGLENFPLFVLVPFFDGPRALGSWREGGRDPRLRNFLLEQICYGDDAVTNYEAKGYDMASEPRSRRFETVRRIALRLRRPAFAPAFSSSF